MFRRGDDVLLTVDLSRFYPALTSGAKGTVIGLSKRGFTPVLRVQFPGAGVRDIRLAYLQPAGTALTIASGAETAATAEVTQAGPAYENAVLVVGPRGGFRSLTYTRTEAGTSELVQVTNKAAIDKALSELEANGVVVARQEG